MSADLTCKACRGSGWERSFVNPWPDEPCPNCHGEGRRLPELHEWDALKADYEHEVQARTAEWREAHVDARIKQYRSRAHRAEAERDRYREALKEIESRGHSESCNRAHRVAHQLSQRSGCCCHIRDARAALDSDPDLAERTQGQP